MKNSDNIEKLFKETFDRFEVDVNPNVWTNVQSGIKSVSGGSASAAAKFTIGKIIAGAASVAIIAGSVWYFASSDNKITPVVQNTQEQISVTSTEVSQNITAENQSSGTTNNSQEQKQTASSVPSVDRNSSNNSQQTQVAQNVSSNETKTDAASTENTENTTSQPEAHKYGNASHDDSGMLRGAHTQSPNVKPSKEKSSSNNSTEEQAPTANILASTESGDAPLTVNFSNQGTASLLSWDFGDGSVSRENIPTHTFNKPGEYVVRLTAKNSNGSVSDKITIEVKHISEIMYSPNVFSPNGDRVNDEFFFVMKGIASIDVTIADVKGSVVNKLTTVDGAWNGKKMNGDDAPAGIYFYAGQAIGTDGVSHPLRGSVTLKRTSE